jgi:hypothetical protein
MDHISGYVLEYIVQIIFGAHVHDGSHLEGAWVHMAIQHDNFVPPDILSAAFQCLVSMEHTLSIDFV